MRQFKAFSRIHNRLATRKILLLSATALIILSSIIAFSLIDINEDIRTMLPDEPSEVAKDFDLLQLAPLSRKVIINLKADDKTSTRTLILTSDRLVQNMTLPYFRNVVSGPPQIQMEDLFDFLTESMPNISTENDMERIESILTEKAVREKLSEIHDRLASPMGWEMKGLIRNDPLGFHMLAIEKLKYLSTVPKVRLMDNHFISEDGKSTLIIAETPIEITDSKGSVDLIDHFQKLVEEYVPPSIESSLLCGHRYAAANARTVKKDLFVIFSFSSLAILALFVVYLRSWIIFLVFTVPASVVCIAAVGVSLFYENVSAITIGFGSVILGISVDFAVHLYFALRSGRDNPAKIVAEVSRPLVFGGFTSIAAFSVLLFSNLPGQRQLALFSVIGVSAAMILCLFVLPHMISPTKEAVNGKKLNLLWKNFFPPRWILLGWGALIFLCLLQALTIKFNGDLRSLNLVPDDIYSDETIITETWGNLRGRAIIFAEGAELSSALLENDRLFSHLDNSSIRGQTTSLAPVFPSPQVQNANRNRWRSFWSEQRRTLVRQLIETEGGSLGFSETAFVPFFKRLLKESSPISPGDLRKAGLGEAIDTMIFKSQDAVRVMTLVPDNKEVIELFNKPEIESPNIRIVSQARFGDMISDVLERDFIQFIFFAFFGVVLLLIIFFRDTKKVAASLIPVGTGLIFMAGMAGFLEISFNLFNIVATILVIGLGVDYGIFMVCRLSEDYDHSTEKAVLVSGLTTIAGFGSLVLASHPALHSIGVTVLFGIGAAIPSALLVIPAFFNIMGKTKDKK